MPEIKPDSRVIVRVALPANVLLGSLTTMIYHDRNQNGKLDLDLIIDGQKVRPDKVELMLYNENLCREKAAEMQERANAKEVPDAHDRPARSIV